MGKVQMSATETKKMEKRMADKTQQINDFYKSIAADDAKRNIRIDLLEAYKIYEQNLCLRNENQSLESRRDD